MKAEWDEHTGVFRCAWCSEPLVDEKLDPIQCPYCGAVYEWVWDEALDCKRPQEIVHTHYKEKGYVSIHFK